MRHFYPLIIVRFPHKTGQPEFNFSTRIQFLWHSLDIRFISKLNDALGTESGNRQETTIIIIYFLRLPSVSHRLSCSSRWAYGHDFWYVGVSWWPPADFL